MNSPTRLNRHSYSHQDESLWQPFIRHLPLFGIGLGCLFLTIYIVFQYSPAQLNWRWLPNVYLPFQVASFLTLFFLGSFITLNTRRGYLVAVFFQTLLFLKLQQVVINRQVVLGLIGLFVIIEVLTSLLIFLKTHANFSQKSRPHHRSRHS